MCCGRYSRLATPNQCLASLSASRCRDWKKIRYLLPSRPCGHGWPCDSDLANEAYKKVCWRTGRQTSGKDFPSLNKRKEASKGRSFGCTDYSLLPAFACGCMWPWYVELWRPSCDHEVTRVTRLRAFKNQEAEYDMTEWDNVLDAITELQKRTLAIACVWAC